MIPIILLGRTSVTIAGTNDVRNNIIRKKQTPSLSLKNVRNLDVFLPFNEKTKKFDLIKQKNIVKEYEDLEKKSKEKKKQFFNKINEINAYLMQELNIALPDEKKDFECFSDFLGERFDVPFNSPFRKNLIKNLKKFTHKKFIDLAKIQKTEKILPQEYYNIVELDDINEFLGEVVSNKEVPELKSQNTIFRIGEILISRLQPEKGKIVLVNEKTEGLVGSGELIAVKRISEEILNEYFWIILRSPYVLKQWQCEITGCSRERIGETELNETIIPLPSSKIQEKIITKVFLFYSQAKKLLNESNNLKSEATKLFEKELTK